MDTTLNLLALARRAMLTYGFHPDLPPPALEELNSLSAIPKIPANIRDLRSLLWSSIDNASSLDLDQAEVAERLHQGIIRLQIGIADVDAFTKRGDPLDHFAYANATSVYTPVEVFPMLPEVLSTRLSSLLENEDRLAVIVDMLIDPDGAIQTTQIYQALIRNQAKLDYETIGNWLENKTSVPPPILAVPGLEDQLRIQEEAIAHLHELRLRRGALNLETIEASPVAKDGEIVDIHLEVHNRAKELIEGMMIAANTAIAEYLEAQGVLSIHRVVKSPARWPRIVELAASFGETLPSEPDSRALADFLSRRKTADPLHFPDLSLSIIKLIGPGEYVVNHLASAHEGHFSLAVHDYSHSTAPNRRFVDLVTQRQIKAVLADSPPPYAETELNEIAIHCQAQENAAKKVERLVAKAAMAMVLSNRIGETFDAIVTGASPKGTWVRLLDPPVEGRVVQGEQDIDVGDTVQVKLLSTNPEMGFIDFGRV